MTIALLIVLVASPAFSQTAPPAPDLKAQAEAIQREKEDILKDARLGQLMTENAQMKWEKVLAKEAQLKAAIDAKAKAAPPAKK